MTRLLIDDTTELDISELVDMEKESACEHSSHPVGTWGHQGPAWGIIRVTHSCYQGNHFLICESGYKHTRTVTCPRCWQNGLPRDEVWTLVSVL